jgi:LDH2 family malate/lactate/ureidoglycolate dehydrogenase
MYWFMPISEASIRTALFALKDYVQRLRDTSCHNIKLLHDERVFALVDGGNNPGPIVGKYAMNYAIKKARSLGSGFVSVRGSNHFSTAAYYSLMAADENMIGIPLSIASQGYRLGGLML